MASSWARGFCPRAAPRATAAENLRLSEEAKRNAEAIRREAQVEAREEALKLRAAVENELREKRAEIVKIEERVLAKEVEIDGKLTESSAASRGSPIGRRT